MATFTFTIPGDPVPQKRPRFSRGKNRQGPVRTIDPNAADKKRFAWIVKSQFKGPILDCPVVVEVRAYFPVPKSTSRIRADKMLGGLIMHTKRPDGDNIVKLALDAMNGVVWADDSLITDLTVRKRFSETPCVEVVVHQIPGIEKCN